MNVVDLFAGPGGWDVAARELGLDPLGIEWDDAACQTREAAGLRTVQADVAEIDPVDFGPCDLLVASPPCQAWSMAGKRQGQEDIERVYALTQRVAAGTQEGRDGWTWVDERSRLVVEPLRWTLALRPRFLAFEQVPPVLDYWKHVAGILRREGYSTWAGILSAERYGVPQTRKRAILMASLDGPVAPPEPTHQAYVPGEPAQGEESLLGSLEPWVSMADALGRGKSASVHHAFGTSSPESWTDHHRLLGLPAPVVDTKARGWHYRNGNQANAATRHEEKPAPTLHFGHALNSGVEWTTTPDDEWTSERPATVVQGDPRIARPGHTGTADGKPWQMANAVRVEVQEAAILQGFGPGYPFQGSRTKRFEQVGNAVPPPLAKAILSALLQADSQRAAA